LSERSSLSAKPRAGDQLMPVVSITSSPAASTSTFSASGLMNLSQSWVPLGIWPVPSPRPIMISRDQEVRLGVERISSPFSATAAASAPTKAAGSATCSTTSSEATRSKRPSSASAPPTR